MKGVLFGEKHTFNDWGLTLRSRPVISPPIPKTLYVDIAGADGVLDLTNALTEDVKYENRKMTFEFNVLDARNRWSTIYSDILDHLHGQSMKVILDEDPTYYYEGRLQVNEWKSDKKTSTIVIEGYVEPYKMDVVSTTEEWFWDSFNFEDGVIRYYADIPFDSTKTPDAFHFVVKGRKWIVPTITITTEDGSSVHAIVLTKEGYKIFGFESGVPKKTYDVVWTEGTWIIQINSAVKGTITIDYREGRL